MRAPFCVCSRAEHGEIALNVRVEWVNECVYVTLLPESDWWLLRIEHIFYAFLLSLKIIIAHGSTYRVNLNNRTHTRSQQLRTMLYWNRMMRARSLRTGTRARQRGRKPAQTHRVSSVSSESKYIRIYVALCRFKGLEVAPKRTISFSPTANTIIPYTDCIRAHTNAIYCSASATRENYYYYSFLGWVGPSGSSQCCIFYKNTLPFVVPMRTQTAAVQQCVCVSQRSRQTKEKRKNNKYINIGDSIDAKNRQMKTDSDFSVECCVWVEIA